MSHKPNYKLYYAIFGALMALTVVTVLVSYIDLQPAPAIALGVAIASLKAGLVAAFFMHLKGEHKLIWVFLGITVFTMVGFLLVPLDQYLINDQTVQVHVGGEHGAPEGATHEMPAGMDKNRGAPKH